MKNLILSLACFILVGCEKNIRDIIPVSSSFEPSYSVVENTDISINSAQMLRVKIILPKQLSETEIIDNCRSFVISNYDITGIRNVTMFAYNNESEINGPYTIGIYEFCPYGDWNRTNEDVKNDAYRENYKINQSYFKSQTATTSYTQNPGVGSKIVLNTEREWSFKKQEFISAKTTKLSNNPTDFSDDYIVKIKNGTKATIVDVYSKITGEYEWIAYKVELSDKKTGWVLSDDIIETK